ncbi:MAG: 5-(carboxyamino)imidazole ribonucleotide synthase [Woeseia sp.]|nr:5-(carboxyamino)imidazole ribonucleotide synthase [Woeseia sp.]MBT8097307.1 5-(carboxyamino)imidazole ribonucleotide synthase [Woeseia sp.]NNE62256.1 5-(carboxyamino)imidazole ribonucleotide synthase [Woeseia sp.]NNL54450.1 5-(carboxyamino)imidazole ribonucleotide synthase [Woeseia sp.]
MIGAAGKKLGVTCVFLDPADSPPAETVGTVIRKPFDDATALQELARDCDVISYEFENVPVAALQAIADAVPVYPPLAALQQAQDRAHEKALFEELEIPLPRWQNVDSVADLQGAADHVGLPLVLKTRRFGYDGKGQVVVSSRAELPEAFAALPKRPLIAEQWIAFDREISAIGVRNRKGDLATYPLTQNEHRHGILHTSIAPVENAMLAALAEDYLSRLLLQLDYVGVLALELFVVGDTLLANEFAPRVHNSGHWTIEGATTSQFENHLRAVLDLPLGATTPTGHAGMINLIGTMPADPTALCAGGAALHDYGKVPRRGRKLGHVTVIAADGATRDHQLAMLAEKLGDTDPRPD